MAEPVTISSVPPNLNDPEERQAWRTASEAAEKFSSLFYRSLDKPGRPDLPGFYTENAILLWNGNRVESRPEVVAYWTKLPRSQTNLHTLSAQPIQKAISGGSSLVMVNVFGTIKFDGNPSKTFSETFSSFRSLISGGSNQTPSDSSNESHAPVTTLYHMVRTYFAIL